MRLEVYAAVSGQIPISSSDTAPDWYSTTMWKKDAALTGTESCAVAKSAESFGAELGR